MSTVDGARGPFVELGEIPGHLADDALVDERHVSGLVPGEPDVGPQPLGEQPSDPARLYGVVVDMPVDDGLDTLAGYADGSCRYVNHSGKVLVWAETISDSTAEWAQPLS